MSSPTIYTAVLGDTFSSVARKTTGKDTEAAKIRSANPGVVDPIQAGTVLQIPNTTTTQTTFKADGLDLRVNEVAIGTLPNFSMSTAVDGFRKASFTVPNEIPMREVLPNLTPYGVNIGYNSTQIMTGYLETPTYQDDETSKSMTIDISSLPQVLADTSPSLSAFPMDFKDRDLQKIANYICQSYSLETSFYVDPGARFTKTDIKQYEKSLAYLSRLAIQRAMVIGDDAFGAVVFTDGASAGAPILEIDDEQRSDVTVLPKYNTSKYYSSVTGILKSKTGRSRKEITVANPHYVGIIKPHRFEIKDSDEGELETAVNSVAARMFAEVFNVEITVPGWTDKNGELIEHGRPVKVRAPDKGIEDFVELDIRNATLNTDDSQQSATVNCVLPGVFAGVIPETVPWRRS
jgi:prophage tail gpP-like protein